MACWSHANSMAEVGSDSSPSRSMRVYRVDRTTCCRATGSRLTMRRARTSHASSARVGQSLSALADPRRDGLRPSFSSKSDGSLGSLLSFAERRKGLDAPERFLVEPPSGDQEAVGHAVGIVARAVAETFDDLAGDDARRRRPELFRVDLYRQQLPSCGFSTVVSDGLGREERTFVTRALIRLMMTAPHVVNARPRELAQR